MRFRITTTKAGADMAGDPTFTLERVWMAGERGAREVSHLLDRTYGYRSLREVQWHLAERFGLAPRAVGIEGA